jgi:A/G-specific adenine glycosylase
VTPRYERFVSRWPTIEALAAASDAEILQEWAGLGYYARARNLIACAREVARRGGFPRTAADLRHLRGIGAYTSAAIAAIAFGERAPAVDTNVRRVIARLHGIAEPASAEIGRLFLDLMPDRPGDFVQAMMDLGATICRPNSPRCGECPLKPECAAFASGDPQAFPRPRARKLRPHRHGIAWWIERDGQVWLVRRPAKGILGGMAALPGPEWTDDPPAGQGPLGTVRHIFTHFSLDLHLVAGAEQLGEGWWHPIAKLDRAGLPTLYRKAAQLAVGRDDRLAA